MPLRDHKTIQKKFIIRTYEKLSQIEVVISSVFKNSAHFQLSILGKVTTNNKITKTSLKKIVANKKQELSAVLGKEFQFGFFYNPEFGFLFIAGHLTPTFLTKVDERELASLPSGLSGIFRGLEIDKEEIQSYLTDLKNDKYCLIIRGESDLLATKESLLNLN